MRRVVKRCSSRHSSSDSSDQESECPQPVLQPLHEKPVIFCQPTARESAEERWKTVPNSTNERTFFLNQGECNNNKCYERDPADLSQSIKRNYLELPNPTSLHNRRPYGRKLAMNISAEDRMAFRLLMQANLGHGMQSVREWLQDRFSSIELTEASQQSVVKAQRSSIITPDNIPEFVIPPRWEQQTDGKRRPLQATRSLSIDSTRSSASKSARRPKSRSVTSCVSLSAMEDTNGDPRSLAAVSIPHLRTQTPYGFTTVSENPHSRRKESLLLGSNSFDDLKLFNRKISGSESPSIDTRLSLVPGDKAAARTDQELELRDESSPPPFPSGQRYERRRSSLADLSDTQVISSESDCETDSIKPLQLEKPKTVLMTKNSFDPKQTALGELKLSLQYFSSINQIGLTIIKADNLASHLETVDINSSVQVCIMPGKSQIQTSPTVKSDRTPQYDHSMVFSGITTDSLVSLALRIRVCNKTVTRSSFTRTTILGQILLPLEPLSLGSEEEVRMWRNLQPKAEHQHPGSVKLMMRFEPRSEKLIMEVIEAKHLPKSFLTGGLDRYVQITVKQHGRPDIRKQTKVRKATNHPIFRETFIFSVSPKVADLQYMTILVKIYNKEIVRTDWQVGQVELSSHTFQEANHLFWSKVLTHAATDVTQWLHLSEPSSLDK